ncbi:MAG: hypothetical protein L0Z53_18220 [Acidobacteriales bacterium]|nr:hypothetical protein [Terriglobales bacterium]
MLAGWFLFNRHRALLFHREAAYVFRRHYRNMPKWLQEMVAPTLMLWLFAVAFGLASAIGPDGLPKRGEWISSFALSLVVASWVVADARKRSRPLCYDYDAFVYFAWPVVVPIYLFQTRGVRAFLTLLCFAGIWVIAALTGASVLFVQELVQEFLP